MISVTTVPVKTYLTKSKIPGFDYAINPYIGCPNRCIYCYAEYMRKFTGHSEPWGQFLDVKVCHAPLKPAQLFHMHILLSSVTDAYNPFEKKYELTRCILQQLVYCQAYVHILTKSSLVLRDMDLLKQLPQSEVCFSFSSSQDTVRQQLEPQTSGVDEKINALQTLHENNIQTAVMIAPIFPQITDWKTIIAKTRAYTNNFRFDSLNMRPYFFRRVMDFIEVNYPHLVGLYTDIYLNNDKTYWQNLAQEIKTFCATQQLNASVFLNDATEKQPVY